MERGIKMENEEGNGKESVLNKEEVNIYRRSADSMSWCSFWLGAWCIM